MLVDKDVGFAVNIQLVPDLCIGLAGGGRKCALCTTACPTWVAETIIAHAPVHPEDRYATCPRSSCGGIDSGNQGLPWGTIGLQEEVLQVYEHKRAFVCVQRRDPLGGSRASASAELERCLADLRRDMAQVNIHGRLDTPALKQLARYAARRGPSHHHHHRARTHAYPARSTAGDGPPARARVRSTRVLPPSARVVPLQCSLPIYVLAGGPATSWIHAEAQSPSLLAAERTITVHIVRVESSPPCDRKLRSMPFSGLDGADPRERAGALARSVVSSMRPSATATEEPIEIKIEQLRQWGFCVIPNVIPQPALAQVATEVSKFQGSAKQYYQQVTGMTDDMRAKMMQKLSTSPASQLEQRQLAGVSGAGTITEATPSGVQPVDWRAKHIEEAYTYRRGATGHGTVSQAAFVPRFADSLAEPRVLAVARAVLDQHIRVAQVEALGKSVQPAVRTNGSHRGWQCVSGP